MKQLVKGSFSCGLLCLLIVFPASLAAQEWSAEQKQVWTAVEAQWRVENNLEEFLATMHPNFSGWSYGDPLPSDKASVKKWHGHNLDKERIFLFELKPVAIQVHGTVAVVHYYYREVVKGIEGKEETRSGRFTDVWMKDGEKWLVIGWHGGQTAKE